MVKRLSKGLLRNRFGLPVILIGVIIALGVMTMSAMAAQESTPASTTLRLEGVNGNVTILANDKYVQFVVSADDLSRGKYFVTLEDSFKSGVTLGPGDSHIHFGEMKDDASIQDNFGKILLWSVQPARVVHETTQVVLRDSSYAEVARTTPIGNLK